VPQVRLDRAGVPVDQLRAHVQEVKGLVPELPLGLRLQDPVADPGQRRRDHQGADQIRSLSRDRLGDPAADVIPGDRHRRFEPELPDQPDQAASLGGRGVLVGRLHEVLVRLAEPAQVRDHHVGLVRPR